MSEIRVKSVKLANGYTLEVFDMSRRISADAFLIKLRFAVEVPVTEEAVASIKMSADEVKETLKSDTCLFKVEVERNFIFEQDADALKEELMDSYLKTNETYLNHSGFGPGLIKRRLIETKRVW